jgi:hypothetical protein
MEYAERRLNEPTAHGYHAPSPSTKPYIVGTLAARGSPSKGRRCHFDSK